MDEYVDPRSRARFATVALGLHIALELVYLALSLMAPEANAATAAGIALSFVLIGRLGTLIGSFVLVAMWVYRVNANAHSFADGLAITPGWNVGWFFVPVANLWKPFEGIRETWQASDDPANWPSVPVPPLLRLWWGCWLVGSIVGNLAIRLNRSDGVVAATPLQMAEAVLSAVSGALLIVIIGRLTPIQQRAQAARVFA